MARNLVLENVAVNAEANALAAAANDGFIRLRTAVGVVAAELRLGNPAFGGAALGMITANAITPDAGAVGGIVTQYQVFQNDGATLLWTGTVGTVPGDFDLVMNSTDIQAGAEVTITSLVHTVPKSV